MRGIDVVGALLMGDALLTGSHSQTFLPHVLEWWEGRVLNMLQQ
jgi:hypothetical protein